MRANAASRLTARVGVLLLWAVLGMVPGVVHATVDCNHGGILGVSPSLERSSVPAGILVVGHDESGVADPRGTFTVTVRDLAGNPLTGRWVAVEFLPCSGVRLCTTQAAPIAEVSCGPDRSYVMGCNAPDGTFTAIIEGSGRTPTGMIGPECMRISAQGVRLASTRFAVLDLAGSDGLGANDLSIWLDDFGSGLHPQRSDYDFNGVLGANDFSLWLSAFGSGQSALSSGGATCP